jgi:enamine deaminase RidA (YjgF/YER057c/UK114 family)
MITHVNPKALHTNPAFSQATIAPAGRTLYIGGQNGTDGEGAIVSADAGEQSAQAVSNILAILDDVGATLDDVAKLTIYLHESVDINAAFAAVAPVWAGHPTAISGVKVSGLARPDALIEIDAIVALPD